MQVVTLHYDLNLGEKDGHFLGLLACRGHGPPGDTLAFLPSQCGLETESKGTCKSDLVTMATALSLQL